MSGNCNFPLCCCSCHILSGRMQVCAKGVSGCVQGEEVTEEAVTGGVKYVNPVHCFNSLVLLP